MSGFGISSTMNMTGCVEELIKHSDFMSALCLLHSVSITSDNSECEPISLIGVKMKSYQIEQSCMEGWRSIPDGRCERDPDDSTTSVSAIESSLSNFNSRTDSLLSSLSIDTVSSRSPSSRIAISSSLSTDGFLATFTSFNIPTIITSSINSGLSPRISACLKLSSLIDISMKRQ